MTEISWTDKTWNPTAGCSLASPGCTNCYAMRDAHRMAAHPNAAVSAKYAGTTTLGANGKPVWTGKINVVEKTLLEPLTWRGTPRRVFVNSMSDVFHDNLPTAARDRIFAVMALADKHTFQVLTKRAEITRAYVSDPATPERINAQVSALRPGAQLRHWPLPNVWLGVSAEDQRRANERIPVLLDVPAVVRFVSVEPLLGAISLAEAVNGGADRSVDLASAGLDWVIVGGESGPAAREMHPAWAEALRDECDAAGVSFFFKQIGAWAAIPAVRKSVSWLTIDGERVASHTPGAIRLSMIGAKAAGELIGGVVRQVFPDPELERVVPWSPAEIGKAA
nr:phage Gp37/Gp68 family protein [uncultured Dongia sp.]